MFLTEGLGILQHISDSVRGSHQPTDFLQRFQRAPQNLLLIGWQQIKDEPRREAFVRELTERTLENFFEARGIETPEFSFAIHRRETTDVFEPGRDNPHAHIILPGTYESWADGARLPLYMNCNRRENHIDLLHDIAQFEIDLLLQREVGPDWEQRYDAMMTERETPHPIQHPLAPTTPKLPPQAVSEPEPPKQDREKHERPPRWSGPSLDL